MKEKEHRLRVAQASRISCSRAEQRKLLPAGHSSQRAMHVLEALQARALASNVSVRPVRDTARPYSSPSFPRLCGCTVSCSRLQHSLLSCNQPAEMASPSADTRSFVNGYLGPAAETQFKSFYQSASQTDGVSKLRCALLVRSHTCAILVRPCNTSMT